MPSEAFFFKAVACIISSSSWWKKKKKTNNPHNIVCLGPYLWGGKNLPSNLSSDPFKSASWDEVSNLAPKENNALWVWVWDWVRLVFRQLLNRCQEKGQFEIKALSASERAMPRSETSRGVFEGKKKKQPNKQTNFSLFGVWKGAELVFSHCLSTLSHRCFWKRRDQITKPFSASQLLSWVFNF